MLLKDKTALVFGEGEIADGIATALAAEGAQVVLAHTGGPAPQAGAGVRVCPVADRGDGGALARLVREETPAIDILATVSIPVTMPTRLEDMPADAHARAFAANVDPVLALMRAAMPIMRDRGGGHIIVGGSIYGPNADRYIADYVASMGALEATVRSAAAEWGPHQIICNMLVPVARTAEFQAYADRYPDEARDLIQQLPLQRVGDPVKDIGGAALFLASDDSCYVTGQVIYADGGQHLSGALLEPTHDRARAA